MGAGQTIVWLLPDRATMKGALEALAYVGTRDDLPLVEACAQGTASTDNEIRQLVALTAKAIVSRSQSGQ